MMNMKSVEKLSVAAAVAVSLTIALIFIATAFNFNYNYRPATTLSGLQIPRKVISMDTTVNDPTSVIVVAQDGSGHVSSIGAAIEMVPEKNRNRVVIHVKEGVYREKLLFPKNKPYITLRGDGAAKSAIVWDDFATKPRPDGSGGTIGTHESYTVAVLSDHFIATDIAFYNTANPPAGQRERQAVAIRVNGDMAVFYRCSFYGAQDTLYDKQGRHLYLECFIQGSVDFIFGNGRSLFLRCHLNSVAEKYGAITAQNRRSRDENTGFSFVGCKVTGNPTLLGRAWGDYSTVVFSYTNFVDDIILPVGWTDFGHPQRSKTAYHAEYQNYGPGSLASTALGGRRASWSRILPSDEARRFLTVDFIDGRDWLPENLLSLALQITKSPPPY